MHIAVIIN